MVPYQIIVADDHLMFRQGIKRIIEETPDLEVVGEANDGLELLRMLKILSPDMVILDISMPNLRGIEATHEIKNAYPQVKVLILTMHKDKEHLLHAISAGAEGYLLKEDADTELFSAIRTIRLGGVYLSPLLSVRITDVLLVHRSRERLEASAESLTIREREVLKLIAEGKSSKEMATLLCISVRTIHHHRASVMKKLSIRKTADLIKYAIRKGYTSTIP